MTIGPVFTAELLTTARRPRYYAIRFVYGLIILFQIYLSYQSRAWMLNGGQGTLRIRDMADFGQNLFNTFAVVQAVAIVFLTPALVGGAIADERQRKTLHYLLTSQLSSAQIVLGKLAARLLHVGVLVALGLPVVSLIGLFGGIDFQVLLVTYAATLTTAYFLATGSILISVVSRRPREAISLIYGLEIVWLAVPTFLIYTLPRSGEPWATIAGWVNPALEYIALTSPFYLRVATTNLWTATAWGMGLQVVYGTGFAILAAARLRPSFRKEGATPAWSRGLARLQGKRHWFPRSGCGDDAMLWKEMHVSRTGGLTKGALVLMGVSLVGVIGYTAFGFLSDAMDEMWRDGYFAHGSARSDFNGYLRGISVGVYILWFMGVASSAATGLTSEREEDQWTSLTSTPLTGAEILRAKLIGPVWGLRLVAYLLFLLWGVGLAVGSIHPFGLFACLVELVVFTAFLTALGNFFSLRSKNSTRALASTIGTLVFLNGGYLFCCIPFQTNSEIIFAGSTPVIFGVSLLGVQDFQELTATDAGKMMAACVTGVFAYAIAAAALMAWMVNSFDDVLDRPDLHRQDRTRGQRRARLDGWDDKKPADLRDFA
jgi:ABC-type transport system involved in multi-copper enzyme maturation permease subunit